MHIKQVIVEGFMSYREQVSLSFTPKVNILLGAKGSGKSNFFHAIRFMLSDIFQILPREHRHALLHERGGNRVLSAFVEIVFDNTDCQIPVDTEEVRLRRTIGLEKDEYCLNGKLIKKTKVMNLLERAGFSCSNPCYFVLKEKITSWSWRSDSELLDLLKEIGGTRVYEERRYKCLKMMRENGHKREQIIASVKHLDERLRELVEKKEDHQYVKLAEKREELLKRKAKLDADDERIRKQVTLLDRQKDESIERIFNDVARNFTEVVSELVPGGHGFLVLTKKEKYGDDDGDNIEQDERGLSELADNTQGRVEKYTGVQVEVLFTDMQSSKKMLSESQEKVVALALMFAMQRYNPAPFYIFDEIDADVDPQYITAVGNIIRRLADHENTQFIITTFCPELVTVADKIYGVIHEGVSRVGVVDKDSALLFIEDEFNG